MGSLEVNRISKVAIVGVSMSSLDSLLDITLTQSSRLEVTSVATLLEPSWIRESTQSLRLPEQTASPSCLME